MRPRICASLGKVSNTLATLPLPFQIIPEKLLHKCTRSFVHDALSYTFAQHFWVVDKQWSLQQLKTGNESTQARECMDG